MKNILQIAVLGWLLSVGAALAGAGTLAVAPCLTSCSTIKTVTDGSSNNGAVIAIGDGTALANLAAVKAGSTPAVLSDPALVVAIRDGGIQGFTNNSAFSGANVVGMGGLQGSNIVMPIIDPCEANAQTDTPISITGATATKIATGVSGKKIYVCSLFLFTSAANNVAIMEGTTGGTCGSGAAGVIGGATAANGVNMTANQGFTANGGGQHIASTATNNDDLCLIPASATILAGHIVWVTQ